MADFFTFENSQQSQLEENIYSEKQWRWFADSNNGNYLNQVSFDLTGLANATGFCNPRELVLALPMIAVISQNNAAGLPNDLSECFAMKNGYYNIIDSTVITYDGQTSIQQSCSNMNYYVSFDRLTKMSKLDLDVVGPSIGFYPDSHNSWNYHTADSPLGIGLTNNDNTQTIKVPAIAAGAAVAEQTLSLDRVFNQGFVERNSYISTQSDLTKNKEFKTESQMSAELYPYTKRVSTPNARDYQAFYFVANIRLKDISSFIDKCSLTKAFYARIIFNINTGSVVLTRTANTGVLTAMTTNFRYNTCPFMLSSNFSSKLADATTQVVVGLHLQKVLSTPNATINQNTLGVENHQLPTCRIYAPLINLDPDRAIKYIQSNQEKYIEYNEIVNVVHPNIGKDNYFNINVSNSIVNPIGILVVPVLSSTQLKTPAGVAWGFSQSLSPFDSCPATTCPLVSLTQFNIKIAGKNVFAEPILYNYEMFMNELSIHNGISGNQMDGLASSLLSYKEFLNNYRYYYVDLSRKTGESKEPKSIIVEGRNNSPVTIDLYIFVIRKKSLTLNVETGHIVKELEQ